MRQTYFKTSDSSGAGTRTFVVRTSFIANYHYSKEIRCDVDKLKGEVTLVRTATQNWQTSGEKSLRIELMILIS